MYSLWVRDLSIESILFPVAYCGVTEQREELEKPWGLKANHISTEYPVAYGGDFLLEA